MDANVASNNSKQYIILKFDSEQYGLDISYIDNIVRVQPITRVPHAQPYFLGIINLRGEVVPVMSMRRKFELPDKENTNASRILILKVEGNAKIGILVDEVREVVTLEEEQIEQVAAESEARSYLIGIGKYNDTLISLLNIAGLICDIDTEV
ncbi:MAG: chemotaxis protein CheW [Wujia sp.]